VRDGRIAEIGAHLKAAADEDVLDVPNAIVAPGFIDMHVHLRQPGYSQKETIESGTQAAVRGGFTAVACMPNTNPALDDPSVINALMQRVAREATCRVHPIAAMTLGREGFTPCDFASLAKVGAVAFSDDGDTVENAAVMREAALLARDIAGAFISHCEPEESIVARDLQIAGQSGKTWHVAHVSTAAALELIRQARSREVEVTCEVTPHHLHFTRDLLGELGGAARVNPPLRSEDDVAALRRAVRDGTIDAFASDHAPHTAEEKDRSVCDAAPGFSGLEVAVGAYAAALPDLPLTRFVEMLSTNPARILGIRGGSLATGELADITIFADREWTVDPTRFASMGKCTPFAGRRLPRKVLATIVEGLAQYRTDDLAA